MPVPVVAAAPTPATWPAPGRIAPGGAVLLTFFCGIAVAAPVDFNRDVRPLLSDRCFACHGPDQEHRQAGLRLDDPAIAGSILESGEIAIVPGDVTASTLVARVTSRDPDRVMPPPHVGKPITPAEADVLQRWIAQGADYRGHWAFARIERPSSPPIAAASWPRTPVDHFILARLEQADLSPNPEAERITLARRVALDLTGLPPAPDAVDDFLADAAADAYDRYVDRLLASPHYGERMAIEWLDAARYADSHGYQTDSSRSNWPWRDWLIDAYNRNLPFDRFTIEQLAGDMLENAGDSQVVATGFNRNHRLNGEGGLIAEEWRVETVIDRVETTGQTWLGLTVGCSRCHDHKYDPLTQREFYALFALFNNVPETGTMVENRRGGNADPVHAAPTSEQARQLAELERAAAAADADVQAAMGRLDALLAEWEEALAKSASSPGPAPGGLPAGVQSALAVDRAARSPAQKSEIEKHYRQHVDGPIRRAEAARDAARKAVNVLRESLPSAMVMKEGPPRDAFVLVRGEYDKRGEKVGPGLPAFLPALPEGTKPDRLALARWIVSRDNPLTARVWVNRQWERFFGTGLVRTSENLGSQAEYPSHPELLDWLAAEFMEGTSLPPVNGVVAGPWDMKAFVKMLVTSAVYRQSAAVSPEKLARDPANRLLARAPRIRLPGEIVRDSALAAAGLLVPAIGGPSVRPWMPDGVWDETSVYGDLRGYKPDTGAGRYRRSMYTVWKRTAGPPTMLLFDAPNRETCTVRRSRTNTPLQALALLNEPTFIEAAQGLARRMVAAGGASPAERIAHGFRLAIGRPPAAAELAALVAGYEADLAAFEADRPAAEKFSAAGVVARPAEMAAAEFAATALTASVILNLDEFVTRE